MSKDRVFTKIQMRVWTAKMPDELTLSGSDFLVDGRRVVVPLQSTSKTHSRTGNARKNVGEKRTKTAVNRGEPSCRRARVRHTTADAINNDDAYRASGGRPTARRARNRNIPRTRSQDGGGDGLRRRRRIIIKTPRRRRRWKERNTYGENITTTTTTTTAILLSFFYVVHEEG